jgi:hypothetical protein
MVDALASGASVLVDVEVRVLFWAPLYLKNPYLYNYFERLLRSFVPNYPKVSYQIDWQHLGLFNTLDQMPSPTCSTDSHKPSRT